MSVRLRCEWAFTRLTSNVRNEAFFFWNRLHKVSNISGACSSNPCQNGGTCTSSSNTYYYCICVEGTYGTNCQYGTPIGTYKYMQGNYCGTIFFSIVWLLLSSFMSHAFRVSLLSVSCFCVCFDRVLAKFILVKTLLWMILCWRFCVVCGCCWIRVKKLKK